MAASEKGEVSGTFPHLQRFNPNPKTLTWERLENKRLNKLGFGAKRYSRHFQRFQREPSCHSEQNNPEVQIVSKTDSNGVVTKYLLIGGELKKMNSLAPFYTQEKPTCGFFFSRITDNKKKKFGIPPSDLTRKEDKVENLRSFSESFQQVTETKAVFCDTTNVSHSRPHCKPGGSGSAWDTLLGIFPIYKGRILRFDFNDPTRKVSELEILGRDWNQSDFHPQGLSAWVDSKRREVTLMVINHASNRDQVEVFRFQRESKTLLHENSITDEHFTFVNDLIMTSETTFFTTKYFSWRNHARLSLGNHAKLEYFLMLQYGEIFYYDGRSSKSVATWLHHPNGINISPDKKYLYVSEQGKRQVKSYRILAKNKLEHIENVYLDSPRDNIEVDQVTGDLWIGSQPIFHLAIDQLDSAEAIKIPSQILKVKAYEGRFGDAVEVYLDPGTEMSGCTVASIYKGHLLGGTLCSNLLLCELVNNG